MDTRKRIDDPDGDIYSRRNRVVDNGPRIRSWSVSGVLRPGQAGREVSAQVDLSKDPGYHTIEFSIQTPPISGSLALATVAEVIWSVKGNQVRRLLNVTNGSVISGLADNVSVKIFDASDQL